jgi:hypothetical protein
MSVYIHICVFVSKTQIEDRASERVYAIVQCMYVSATERERERSNRVLDLPIGVNISMAKVMMKYVPTIGYLVLASRGGAIYITALNMEEKYW